MMGRQEAICQAGYDATFRSARLRGSIDTAGVVRAQLEEKIVPGATLSVSAEIDHARQEHRFGLGLSTDPMGP